MPKEQKKESFPRFVYYFGQVILREIWDKMTLDQKKELIPERD